MRRLRSLPSPDILNQAPSEKIGGRAAWRGSWVLSTITPVVGGGVEALVPDEIDVVRVPGIRGQLRSWWRFLYGEAPLNPFAEESDGQGKRQADALFLREAALWGGVGVGAEKSSMASRVRLRVQVLDPGKTAPAGWHNPGPNSLRPLPTWSVGKKLGYALFPFQRSRDERLEHGNSGAMPTREVRQGLRFQLEVSVHGTLPEQAPEWAHVREVLASLWAWIHLGGLGGRTRRGFGALAVDGTPTLRQVSGLDLAAWSALFRGPGDDIGAWWSSLETEGAVARLPRMALVGPAVTRPEGAHGELIEHLATFRQGVGTGRDPGRSKPAGESRWPEPDLLRLERFADAANRRRYEHPPNERTTRAFEEGNRCAPRAAFGLPIQVQFYFRDKGDQRANAQLLPGEVPDSRRWASPLVLRPVRTASGRYAPIAAILGPGPESVRIEFASGGDRGPRKVQCWAGAQEPIRALLKQAGGNALLAFASWLKSRHRYRPFVGGFSGGQRNA